MSEWKEYKLGELVEISTGYAFKGDKYDFKGELRVVRGENVTIGKLRWDSEKYWNRSIIGLEQYYLRENDIVIGMDGSRVGHNRAKIKLNELPLILAQRVARLRAKENSNQEFIWYNIFSSIFKDYVEAIHTGTSIPHISQNQISNFDILLPPLPEQTAIASILSSLDDKIDLLHRQNATLEKMAETLFRQWFVEEAKEEWEEKSLYECIELIGGGTPKTTVEEYWNGNVKWLSGGDISNNHKNFVIKTEKTITENGLKNSSAKLAPKFSTIISARGTVGKYCILSEPMTFSQSNYGVLPKYQGCFFFTYLLVAHSVDELLSAAYGSVFDTITTNTFKGLNITLPKENQILLFEESVKFYFQKILSNQTQIQTLTSLRDNLLPKLMSGEVRVKI